MQAGTTGTDAQRCSPEFWWALKSEQPRTAATSISGAGEKISYRSSRRKGEFRQKRKLQQQNWAFAAKQGKESRNPESTKFRKKSSPASGDQRPNYVIFRVFVFSCFRDYLTLLLKCPKRMGLSRACTTIPAAERLVAIPLRRANLSRQLLGVCLPLAGTLLTTFAGECQHCSHCQENFQRTNHCRMQRRAAIGLPHEPVRYAAILRGSGANRRTCLGWHQPASE